MPKGKRTSTAEKWVGVIAAYRSQNDEATADAVAQLCGEIDEKRKQLMTMTKKFRRALKAANKSA